MVIDFFLLVEYNFYYGINDMRSTVFLIFFAGIPFRATYCASKHALQVCTFLGIKMLPKIKFCNNCKEFLALETIING